MNFLSSPIFKALDFLGLRSVITLSAFSNFLLLAIPVYTLQVYDRVLLSRSSDTLIFLSVGIIIALFIVGISDTLKSYLLIRFSNKLENKLSNTIMDSIINDGAKKQKSSIVPLREQEKIKNFLGGHHGLITFFDAPWIPVFVFIVFLIHPMLSLVLVFFMLALFITTILTDKASAHHLEEASKASNISYTRADEIARNAQMISAMGMKQDMINDWSTKAKETSYFQSLASHKAAFYISIAKLLRYSQTIILTAFGAYFAINNEMTIGGMIAANILASKAAAPMEGLISSWKNFHATKESFVRLNTLLEKQAKSQDKTTLPEVRGEIECKNLIFAPNKDQEPILKNINFKINAGEFLGIIGPSGSGKSSIVKTLVGVYDITSGHVNIDGADINIWDTKQLGSNIGYLSQDVVLLNGTIKQNIARFTQAEDETVIEAATKANAHELILSLPQGYDTPVGVEGHILSGGQRQRIGLARAFFKNPKIILLDEPNSSLDNDGDLALIKALENMKKLGSTIIVIAHRPSILKDADKLAVFSAGSLQLFGPYKEVAAKLMPNKS